MWRRFFCRGLTLGGKNWSQFRPDAAVSVRAASTKRDLLNYDAVVVGLSGAGCAALYHLAKAGYKVLGIEKCRTVTCPQFPNSVFTFHCPRHYHTLLQRALTLWKRLEDSSEREILVETGSLYCGVHYDAVFEGIEWSELDHEELRGVAIAHRYAQLRLPLREHVLLTDLGGSIQNAAATETLFELAKAQGAKFRFGEEALDWTAEDGSVKVVTNNCIYSAANLVLAGGTAAASLIPELQVVYQRVQRTVELYRLAEKYRAISAPPVPVLEYDVTANDRVLVSALPDELDVCLSVDSPHDRDCQSNVHWPQTFKERFELEFTALCPGIKAAEPVKRIEESVGLACDEDLILDRHPTALNVIVAIPNAELGFVCSPVIGEILALMISEKDQHLQALLEPFSLQRPSLRYRISASFYTESESWYG